MNNKTFGFVLYILAGLFAFSACLLSQEVKLVQSENIFKSPPFAACHASTIVELEKGELMAAWFGGSYEGGSDVCIYTALYKNGLWGEPQKVATGSIDSKSQIACWNPVLFKAENRILYLFYKVGINPREWWGMVKISTDEGKTWGKEIKLPDGFLGPIRNKPVQLTDGTIVCPSSTESIDGKWNVHIELVDSSFTRWEKIPVDTGSDFGVIQPAILVHKNGELQILCRSRQNCIVHSWSHDKANSWEKLSCLEIPNPNSGIDAVGLSNGQFLLVYNPLLQGKDWFIGRNILRVAISDDGIEWHDILTLENQPEGEFSYPAVIQSDDGKVHITYTINRLNIKHVVLKIED